MRFQEVPATIVLFPSVLPPPTPQVPAIKRALPNTPQHAPPPSPQVPEIKRVPLEELVLQIHVMGLDPAAQFLQGIIEPPADTAVRAAIASLQVGVRAGGGGKGRGREGVIEPPADTTIRAAITSLQV